MGYLNVKEKSPQLIGKPKVEENYDEAQNHHHHTWMHQIVSEQTQIKGIFLCDSYLWFVL